MKTRQIACLLLCLFLALQVSAQPVATAKENGKWGFIGMNGKWFIRPAYDSVENFYHGYAKILKNGLEGLIDRKGTVVLQPEYDYVGHVYDGRTEVFRGDFWKFYDVKTGNFLDPDMTLYTRPVPPEGKSVTATVSGSFISGRFSQFGDITYNNLDREEEKMGMMRSCGLVVVADKSIPVYKVFGSEGAFGVVYGETDTVMKPVYEDFGTIQDTLFLFVQHGLYGLANTKGSILLKPVYNYLGYFTEGLAPARLGRMWGFITPAGKEAVAFRYENSMNFKHALAAVQQKGKWGFIDPSGQWRIPARFETTDGNFREPAAGFDPLVPVEEWQIANGSVLGMHNGDVAPPSTLPEDSVVMIPFMGKFKVYYDRYLLPEYAWYLDPWDTNSIQLTGSTKSRINTREPKSDPDAAVTPLFSTTFNFTGLKKGTYFLTFHLKEKPGENVLRTKKIKVIIQ